MSAGPAALAAALPGIEIGPELGRGGFGIVYAGKQRRLGREVAIKQLPPSFADDAEIRERFVTEARVLASLDHPHIVPVYDYVEQDGLCLLVMECLPGGTVWDVFRKEGLHPGLACVITVAAAAGLHHAHINGVLHRDVKPENLLLTLTRHLKVTDFGIAKVIGGAEAIATSNGDILGTPAYMAPEQAIGGDLGPAADVYAAGVMLYELLSGQLPYSQDGGGLAIVYRHLHESPIPLPDVAPHIPRPVADVVMQALAREPGDRFASAEEFAVAVAGAAVDGFGNDWYSASGIRVIGSDRVMSTLTGPGLYGRRSATVNQSPATVNRSPATVDRSPATVNRSPATVDRSPATQAGDPFVPEEVDPRVTRRESWLPPEQPAGGMTPGSGHPSGPFPPPPGTYPPGGNLPALRPIPQPVPAAQYAAIRPDQQSHVVGVISIIGKAEPLVPVRQILDVPPAPTRLAAVSGVLLVLMLVAAWIGIGTSSDHSGTTTSTVTVAGKDVSTGGTVPVDLGSAVPISVSALPAGVQSVRLSVSVHGLQFGKSDAARFSIVPGGPQASVKISSVRYLVGGPVDGRIDLLDAAGKTVADRHFGIEPKSSGFLTIPGVIVILLLLFVLAYLESLVKPLWKFGRWQARSAVGLALIGALFGAVLTGVAWVLGQYQLSLITAIICAVLGAAFAVTGGLTAARWGLQHRVVRINKRTPVLR